MMKDIDGVRHAELKQAYQELLVDYYEVSLASVPQYATGAYAEEEMNKIREECEQLSQKNLNRPFREEI